MATFKEERTKQWGNTNGGPRGWDRWRCSTFLEVIGAKVDRATQAQNLMNIDPGNRQGYYEDAIDSLMDLVNYANKLIEIADIDFYQELRMK